MNDTILTYQQAIHHLKNGGALWITGKGTHWITYGKNDLCRKPTKSLDRVLVHCRLVQEWETGTKYYVWKG